MESKLLPMTVALAFALTLPKMNTARDIEREKKELYEFVGKMQPVLVPLLLIPSTRNLGQEIPDIIIYAQSCLGKVATNMGLIETTLSAIEKRMVQIENENVRAIEEGREKGIRATKAVLHTFAALRDTLNLLKNFAKDDSMLVDLAKLVEAMGKGIGNEKLQAAASQLSSLRAKLRSGIPQMEEKLPAMENMFKQVFGAV